MQAEQRDELTEDMKTQMIDIKNNLTIKPLKQKYVHSKYTSPTLNGDSRIDLF